MGFALVVDSNDSAIAAGYTQLDLLGMFSYGYLVKYDSSGNLLWQQVHDGKAKWEALLPDNVHPSDQGHAIYAQQIRAFLQEHRTDKAKWARKRLPAPVSKDPFESARMIDPSGIAAQGWTRDDPTIRFPHSISADAPGTELKFPFRGTVMGLYWLVGVVGFAVGQWLGNLVGLALFNIGPVNLVEGTVVSWVSLFAIHAWRR